MASAVQLLPPAVPLDSSGSAWLQRSRFDLAVCVLRYAHTLPGMAAPYGPALVEAAEYYLSVYEHLMQLLVLEGIADDPPAVVVVAAEEPAAAAAPAVASAVLLAPYYDPPDCPPPPLPDVQPAQQNQATQTPDSARPVRPPGLFALA